MATRRARTTAERQRAFRARLRGQGGRRVTVVLSPPAAAALDLMLERHGLTVGDAVGLALVGFDKWAELAASSGKAQRHDVEGGEEE